MAIYTFYLCNLGGGASSFEAFDLGSDAEAPARALQMLADHPTCTYVAVWDDARPVLERHRDIALTLPLGRPQPDANSLPI
ncbi:hypothetical protein [Phenylobacterium sp.]|jgi:hypothetical protein|uniref:hypothetical protein n=1 Tax=Phenylobacterium sp. TaxID=1871053 RepID=UPI00121BD6BB|nr:hypothetical protein [Phenylobacterium sp.]THD61146.1 MAG: hypothetical protein E8A12_10165 [Phenylobacterium sp.]